MTEQQKKDHLKLAMSLLKGLNEASKPEKYIDTLTNYNKGVLTSILFYKKEFPTSWKQKFMDATR